MIEVRNISRSFGDKQVVKDFSFTCDKGKTNLIIGESGSGKTVTMKCMVGLLEPDSGNVLYDGKNFTGMSLNERKMIRREIGMLFQGAALFDSMTVEENVMFPLQMFTEMSSQEKLDRVNFCLNRVNIQNANAKFPSEISGGMKKRVAIARAIVLNPKYLFCDEPNSGLDPKTSILIDDLIQEITYEFNMTTLVITHDMNSVMEIGDKIAFFHKGNKAWEGSRHDILQATNEQLVDFVYASKFLKSLRKK
ncbi:MAG: ATP-binding cassette domain-containing protein [Bacteroidia bacterium]|nr:ATP-binding cassette domain-containing protein [Bacteroidia bacterium]